MPKTAKQVEFDRCVKQLRLYVAQLSYVVDDIFPEAYVFDPENFEVTGESMDPPLRNIAQNIDNILGSFDALQEATGIPSGTEPRYRRFLGGECNE